MYYFRIFNLKIIPSINKGKHAFQRPKSALGCVLGFGVRQHAYILRPCQPQFMLAGRSQGVFRERKLLLTRRTRQLGWRPATRITMSAEILASKNRIAPCQSMVISFEIIPACGVWVLAFCWAQRHISLEIRTKQLRIRYCKRALRRFPWLLPLWQDASHKYCFRENHMEAFVWEMNFLITSFALVESVCRLCYN